MSGFAPCSIAAASTKVLNVEPACRFACERRLNWFRFMLGVTAVMARMAPLAGLIEMTAAAGSSFSYSVSRIAFCASRWKRGSMVV